MTAPLKIGSTRQLFLDDHVVERRDGVERQFHRPVRYDGNPVLEVDRLWEGRVGVYLFGGTVLYDESEKVFKMWYRTARPMVKTAGGEVPYTSGAYSFEDVPGYVHPEGAYRACYAVSSDGLSWKKPDLAMVDFEGSTRNNIIPPDVGAGAKGEVRRPNLIKDYDDPDLASVAGTPVRLRFHLNNAALYSFRIGGDSAPPGPFDLNLHAPGNRGRP